jgi:hypothetical protein
LDTREDVPEEFKNEWSTSLAKRHWNPRDCW